MWIWRIFAIDTDYSSNAVLLFLFIWNSPNVYTLVWKHTNKWRNICTFPSAKKIDRQIYNWHPHLFKYSTVISILMKFFKRNVLNLLNQEQEGRRLLPLRLPNFAIRYLFQWCAYPFPLPLSSRSVNLETPRAGQAAGGMMIDINNRSSASNS